MAERTVTVPRCGKCSRGKHARCENPGIADDGGPKCCCAVFTEEVE